MSTPLAELLDDLPELAYLDPELKGERFRDEMARLAREHWLCRVELGVCVLEREAGEFFLRSKQVAFPGMVIAELFGITDGPLHEEMVRNVLHLEGDDHRRLRALVAPAFTPRAADRFRPAMRGFLQTLWDAVGPAGEGDLVEALCKPYPSQTIATVMGAPLADAPLLHEWSNQIQRQFDAPSLQHDRPRIERAVAEFYAWAGPLLEHRRATPSDDLVSTLIAARDGSDRLDDAELVNLVLNVLVGGVDTTQSQLAHALRLFAEHPEQWDALRADPAGRVGAAVEEVLRHEPITPFTARIVLEELEFRGVVFPPRTIVLVAAASANRQEAVPDAFDICADRGRVRSLTFGAGIHYCLGANLAKAELEEALVHLAPRVERWELAGEVELGSINGVYGVQRLPMRWRG